MAGTTATTTTSVVATITVGVSRATTAAATTAFVLFGGHGSVEWIEEDEVCFFVCFGRDASIFLQAASSAFQTVVVTRDELPYNS